MCGNKLSLIHFCQCHVAPIWPTSKHSVVSVETSKHQSSYIKIPGFVSENLSLHNRAKSFVLRSYTMDFVTKTFPLG